MEKEHERALFIHRRDLRVQDNTALNAAVSAAKEVLPCFIFDPKQVGKTNSYRSDRQIAFMIESLDDLAGQYKKVDGVLHLFTGKPAEVVAKLIKDTKIDAVYVNADYTPYSKERDTAIGKACAKAGIPFFSYHDLLLAGDPEDVKTQGGKPFTVFTPYWKRARDVEVHKPVALRPATFVKRKLSAPYASTLKEHEPKRETKSNAVRGGRKEARDTLAHLADFKAYARTHNDPSDETTRLSAHNKFGTVSIREVYHSVGRALGYGHPIIRQLYWRDFYTAIVYYFPHVIGASFDPKHEILFTDYDTKAFRKWQEGKTGVPIVDAGMRELAETGYMHNRVRLIVGSFLTKDLHQAWWLGEKHFAKELVDYDLSVNNGNWQWVGGTGVDPVPYFRVFNPWLQAKKFDPRALYIRHWVPELKDLSAAEIHSIPKKPLPAAVGYPAPMVDHTEEMRKVRVLYKRD